MKNLKRVPRNKRKYITYRMGKTHPLYVTSSCNNASRDYRLKLINNPKAKNPTYAEVVAFLASDKTDEIPYTEVFKCPSYSAFIHNNAEAAGLRCAYVYVAFQGEYYGHCCNAWHTRDKGVIFTDSCGDPEIYADNDKLVGIKIGKEYHPESLTDGQIEWKECGVVAYIEVVW